jgi:hypothetical protein
VSLAARRRCLCVALAAAALWPAIHHVLARTVETDPWKLFGWSMYAAPPGRVQVRIDGVDSDGRRPLPLFGELAEARDAFAGRRASLGRLARPDVVAERVLASDPDLEAVVVVVRRFGLDPETARLFHEDLESRHTRARVR